MNTVKLAWMLFASSVQTIVNPYLCKLFGHGDHLGRIRAFKGIYGQWCKRCSKFVMFEYPRNWDQGDEL